MSHTTLVGGIARLGDPHLNKPFTSPTPPTKKAAMPLQKPAKPAKGKTKPKDEDYATTYQPPVSAPVAEHVAAPVQPVAPVATVTAPQAPAADGDFDINSVVVVSNVPLPTSGKGGGGKIRQMAQPLQRLQQPKDSVGLPIGYKASLQKAMWSAHKAGPARYISQIDQAKAQVRVWRTA